MSEKTDKKKQKKSKSKSKDASARRIDDGLSVAYEHTDDALKRRAEKFSDDDEAPSRDFSYTQNREESWLLFDNRVLDEANDESVPLFERIKFCSIFASNLDEWFMIRVGGLSDLATLKNQPADNKSNETPTQQLDVLFSQLPGYLERQQKTFSTLETSLAEQGLSRIKPASFSSTDRDCVTKFYESTLAPILSPMVVDSRHPFPNLRNGMLYVVCSLDGTSEDDILGMVEVPPTLPRVIELPSTAEDYRFALIEDVISFSLDQCFTGYKPTTSAVIRVTRNADIDPDGEGVEEEEDYRQHMKKVLKRRQRLQPVRLEVEGELDETVLDFVRDELSLTSQRIFRLDMPLDLSYVFGLEGHIPTAKRSALLFEPFEPQATPMADVTKPMRDQIFDHDVLLNYPYESMRPLLNLLHEASSDDTCISIKITLYRVAKRSRLCESLIAAAENGKDVTVLMELRARFDEANNIEWAERLESAGCTVIYGAEGFKCHSKICQITYHDVSGLHRITCLGTGNFNEKTARLYCDFMLLTAHAGIGEDGNAFFRNLSLSNLNGTYRHLGVAPAGLKPLIMRGLDREIDRARAGKPAKVFMKLNSLTDRDVIDKISEATQAGVIVIMVIRGICCIKANVPGKTDGLVVHQIVGRLLEHSRVYAFGIDSDLIYLSSADMMTRNTERRVEICYPILDPTCRSLVVQYMNLQLMDNAKARSLTSDGTWERIEVLPGQPLINSQEVLIALAYRRAIEDDIEPDDASNLARVFASLPEHIAQELRSQVMTPSITLPNTSSLVNDAVDEQEPVVLQRGDESEAAGTNTQATPEPVASTDTTDTTPSAAAHAPEEQPVQKATPVEARIIDEPAHTAQASATAQSAHSPADDSDTVTIQRHHAGRFSLAFALIGAGLRTLFTGKPKREGGKRR